MRLFQLLFTGAILISSAAAAAVVAAKFWENHTAIQLLGFVPPPSISGKTSCARPVAFDLRGAAADFVLGLLSGVLGTTKALVVD